MCVCLRGETGQKLLLEVVRGVLVLIVRRVRLILRFLYRGVKALDLLHEVLRVLAVMLDEVRLGVEDAIRSRDLLLGGRHGLG